MLSTPQAVPVHKIAFVADFIAYASQQRRLGTSFRAITTKAFLADRNSMKPRFEPSLPVDNPTESYWQTTPHPAISNHGW